MTHTGALYRITITSLRAGACEARTFCPPETAGPLAALAPDVSCTATLNAGDLHDAAVLVVGPGLGQSAEGAKCVADALKVASEEGLPVIFDASSLYALAHHASVRGALMDVPDSAPTALVVGDCTEMAKLRRAPALLGHLGCVQWSDAALVRVGDMRCRISNRTSKKPLCDVQHVLQGVTAVFMTWAYSNGLGGRNDVRSAAAATAAVSVTRRAAELAYCRYGRSVMVSDVMDEIPQALEELEKKPSEARLGKSAVGQEYSSLNHSHKSMEASPFGAEQNQFGRTAKRSQDSVIPNRTGTNTNTHFKASNFGSRVEKDPFSEPYQGARDYSQNRQGVPERGSIASLSGNPSNRMAVVPDDSSHRFNGDAARTQRRIAEQREQKDSRHAQLHVHLHPGCQ